MPGDYLGGPGDEIAVFRPLTGEWMIKERGVAGVTTVAWGAPGDQPVPADDDNDGKRELCVFRRGDWLRIELDMTGLQIRSHGQAGDTAFALSRSPPPSRSRRRARSLRPITRWSSVSTKAGRLRPWTARRVKTTWFRRPSSTSASYSVMAYDEQPTVRCDNSLQLSLVPSTDPSATEMVYTGLDIAVPSFFKDNVLVTSCNPPIVVNHLTGLGSVTIPYCLAPCAATGQLAVVSSLAAMAMVAYGTTICGGFYTPTESLTVPADILVPLSGCH